MIFGLEREYVSPQEMGQVRVSSCVRKCILVKSLCNTHSVPGYEVAGWDGSLSPYLKPTAKTHIFAYIFMSDNSCRNGSGHPPAPMPRKCGNLSEYTYGIGCMSERCDVCMSSERKT